MLDRLPLQGRVAGGRDVLGSSVLPSAPMAVTASFLPNPIEVVPGSPTRVTLRLHNDGVCGRVVELEAIGDLADDVVLDAATTTMDTNQIVDIAVTLDVAATCEPGPRTLSVSIDAASASDDSDSGEATARPAHDETVTASATANIVAVTAFAVTLRPTRSKGSAGGRHRVRVVNSGNVAVTVEVEPDQHGAGIQIDAPTPTVTTVPGTTEDIALRVVPADTYWNGPSVNHDFNLRTTASDGSTQTLTGSFEQRPRLPSWFGPAAAGALAALVIASIVWIAFLAPWVEDTADDAAATAIEQDREALQLRIEELEAAAAEAKELPLGSPTDLRLSVAPDGGDTETASETMIIGTTLSVTDVVFQNPTGAVGTVSLRRDDDILLQSELANFRDFDLHLVAPFVFPGSSQVVLEVECRTPGAGTSDCPVGATLLGFVDEAS